MRLLALSSLFFDLLRRILFLWVRTSVMGNKPEDLNLDPSKPVCYVLQYSSLSSRLVLEQECRKAGLPLSQAPFDYGDFHLRRSFFFLYRRQGQLFRRRQSPVMTDRLKQLVGGTLKNEDLDVQIVPVSLYWGRAPEKEKSLFKLIFSDTWSNTGRFRKLLTIMLHGRDTFVQFSKPFSLRQILETEAVTEEIATRKAARILRVHFRRVRQAVIGPDLSHRRTLVSRLIATPAVKDVIRETAKKEDIAPEKVRARAYKYADEMTSNLSMATIRFLDVLLSWVWNKIYNGVNVYNIETVQDVAKDNEVIYVPCHRSHIDYLLLSYVLYKNGVMVPHIAAGINLNMPVVGAILRRGGAFFMRRSFRDNPLYAAVFNEYMHSMLTKGYSVEYFVEGGRSRTGRTLQAKAGMVSMTIRSFLRDNRKPIAFVPVYVGYEKILESRSYLGELRGQKKQKESIFGLFRSLRNLRKSFGKVSVNFGSPIYLAQELEHIQPQWRHQAYTNEYKPSWLPDAVTHLSEKITTHINDAATINPVNIIATVLLSTSKQSMDEKALAEHLDAFCALLHENPYSPRTQFPSGSGHEWIEYVEEMGLIGRHKQELGDIVFAEGNNAVLLTYYRNNIMHLFALPALIASFFQNNETMEQDHLISLIRRIYPYIRSELHIRWTKEVLEARLQEWLDIMVKNEFLYRENGKLRRPAITAPKFIMLSVLARIVMQTLERYFIVIALLRDYGSGNVTADELEKQSTLMAQRMSILYGLNAPEFFDKTMFRNFIAVLMNNQILTLDDDKRILFDKRIDDVAEEARLVLDAELRQGILQVTNGCERPTEALQKLATA
ncbi:MAG: glycerol-3-phosphate 1-O-acyltransferase PlsB [Pseudomonadales bacterium]|nr:glycerol-3-phosphate 1-O-acyltransferase PlsB [Pseudomonadales bacterium]